MLPGAAALRRQIAALLADPGAVRAHWGIAVTGLDGIPIYGLDEARLFRPASNAKLFTTAATLALLGPDAQVYTRLSFVGHQGLDQTPIVESGFDGDLLLSGAGDANFGSARRFPYLAGLAAAPGPPPLPLQEFTAMAARLASLGLKRIQGDIVVDDSIWPAEPLPDTWGLDDILWGYGAPVSAFTVNDNQLKLTVMPGKPGDAATATLTPEIGYYTLDTADLKTGAAATPESLRIERAPGSRVVRISGSLPAGAPYQTELAIDDPAAFSGLALKAALATAGIIVQGEVRTRHRVPVGQPSFTQETHQPIPDLPAAPAKGGKETFVCRDNCIVQWKAKSPPLSEDIAVTLKESQNLHAELLLRRLGAAWGSAGSNAQGVRVLRQWLLNAGLNGEDFFFYDGSGLSSHDLVTPRAITQLLAYAARQPWFAAWKAALPVAGLDGTLGGRFKDTPLQGHVFAKTGTLGESRALSGYVDCASGRTVIFSVMADDHAPTGSNERAVMDRIVAAIAASQ